MHSEERLQNPNVIFKTLIITNQLLRDVRAEIELIIDTKGRTSLTSYL